MKFIKNKSYKHFFLAVCIVLLFSACSMMNNEGVKYYPNSEGLPFSDAVQVGDMLFLSGQLGVVPETKKLKPGGMKAEAKQTMENIGAVLLQRGLTFDDVVKCTVMLDDIVDWTAFNEIYVSYFKAERMPARSAFGADGLGLGAKLELECWAYNPQ